MDPQLHTVEVYNSHAGAYLQKFLHFDLYNDTFDDFSALIPLQGHVLELGCGPGNVMHYFLQQRADLHFFGIDLAPEMVKKAASLNPSARCQVMDIRKAYQIEARFEAIIGAFCLPYLSYEELSPFFQQAHLLTQPKGLLYVSCMEGEKEKSGFEKTSFTGEHELYIFYHQRENLEKELLKHGFSLLHFYTKEYPETDGTVTIDLVYIAQKS